MSGSDLFTGTLDILILRTLSAGPLHGYAVGRAIRDGSEGVLDVEEGALTRRSTDSSGADCWKSEWGRTETGRRAKFYRMTRGG